MRLDQKPRPGVGPVTKPQSAPAPQMRLGIALPRFGELADPLSISRIAERAEALGYDTAWVLERDADGIPDPLTLFAYLAGRTRTICFAAWLATGECGVQDALRRIGGANTVARGRLSIAVSYPAGYYDDSVAYQVPARLVEVAPASSRAPIPGAAAIASCQVTYQPIDGERAPFTGSFSQIAQDIAHYGSSGASELVLDVAYSASVSSLGDYLMHLERLREAAEPGFRLPAPPAAWPQSDDFDSIS